MGKKGYNQKGRNSTTVQIDNSSTNEIVLDIQHRPEDYDTCNVLVLPSKKRKTEIKAEKSSVTRLLSKKRKKQLEKIVERKKQKTQRATLLEELAKVQVSADELKQYTSIATVHTKGLKRLFKESKTPAKQFVPKHDNDQAPEQGVHFAKASKKNRLAIINLQDKDDISTDPNIVGFEESSDSESDSITENETQSKENQTNYNDPVNNKITCPEGINIIEERPLQISPKIVSRVPAVFVSLNRTPEIQASRLKLPVVAEEQTIVEIINENPVIIITGETGSGKTTQIPQFLYEAGYATHKMIGVTEPRRVAAMSMSKRVAEEMNVSQKEVSYLIRFEGNVTSETKIKFMTDGVLLKEIQNDFLLTNYSVIILDEAHERSVYTDILIGLLSRIVPLRMKRQNPLKLIIMSATLRVEEFLENEKLFKTKPPVINIDSRQFPVTIHFNRRTSLNYVKDALRKAIKIHTRLPEGGILIFLTGQREVNFVVRKLRKAFPLKKKTTHQVRSVPEEKTDDDEDDLNALKLLKSHKQKLKDKKFQLPTINLDDYSVVPEDDTHEDLINPSDLDDDDEDYENADEDDDTLYLNSFSNAQPLWVLPLYSLLPADKQNKVFDAPPDGYRLCVVSTNVAETSLTIPNVKYVVDSGRCKTRLYDKVTGVSTYKITYTSKASANQRAGRAGRIGPGHCYRLYSSAVFNDQFEEHAISEIQRRPVDDLLLQMKVMGIDKVVNFPFPTPPETVQLQSAEKRLVILGALQQPPIQPKETYNTKFTPLGKSIAAFPVAPRFGKMLALSHQHDLLSYTICMVAALSVQEVLIEPNSIEGVTNTKWLQTRRFWAGIANSLLLGDPMVLIRAVGAAEFAGSKGKLIQFCEDNGLRHKAIVEIRKLRQQLTNEINLNISEVNLSIDPQMPPPTDIQAKLLRQVVLAGMVDQIAKKIFPDEIKEDQDRNKFKHAYKTLEMEDPVFMHSSCVLRKTIPEWVVYQEIYETNKMYMRGVTAIEPEWLIKFAPTLCNLNEPLEDPPPRYDKETDKVMCHVTGSVGRGRWELPKVEIEYPKNIEGVKWFARFFLEGKVCPKLERFVPLLLSTPASVCKSWAKLIPRIELMTKLLMSHGVMTKDQLLEIWSSDKTFLLSTYQKWLPESVHTEVAAIWPPG